MDSDVSCSVTVQFHWKLMNFLWTNSQVHLWKSS